MLNIITHERIPLQGSHHLSNEVIKAVGEEEEEEEK